MSDDGEHGPADAAGGFVAIELALEAFDEVAGAVGFVDGGVHLDAQ